MDVEETIKKRKSCRKFSDKKPDWREIVKATDIIRFTPMAGENFSLKIIIVDDKEKIESFAESAQQDFIKNAPFVVVFCTNPERTVISFEERGKRYCSQQAGAAIQNFLLRCEELKLNACWIGHYIDDEIKKLLKIPEDNIVEAIIPVGYAKSKESTRKAKPSLDSYLRFNKYDQKQMRPGKKVDA